LWLHPHLSSPLESTPCAPMPQQNSQEMPRGAAAKPRYRCQSSWLSWTCFFNAEYPFCMSVRELIGSSKLMPIASPYSGVPVGTMSASASSAVFIVSRGKTAAMPWGVEWIWVMSTVSRFALPLLRLMILVAESTILVPSRDRRRNWLTITRTATRRSAESAHPLRRLSPLWSRCGPGVGALGAEKVNGVSFGSSVVFSSAIFVWFVLLV